MNREEKVKKSTSGHSDASLVLCIFKFTCISECQMLTVTVQSAMTKNQVFEAKPANSTVKCFSSRLPNLSSTAPLQLTDLDSIARVPEQPLCLPGLLSPCFQGNRICIGQRATVNLIIKNGTCNLSNIKKTSPPI